MKFIHYGHDCFCRYRFNHICNGEPQDTKPLTLRSTNKDTGGLWGSPYGQDSVHDWKSWWERHNQRSLNQVYFIFWLKPEAKILELNSPEDLQPWIRSDSPIQALDFEKITSQYSAILARYTLIEQLQETTFKGWNCETILVLDPKMIISPRD